MVRMVKLSRTDLEAIVRDYCNRTMEGFDHDDIANVAFHIGGQKNPAGNLEVIVSTADEPLEE